MTTLQDATVLSEAGGVIAKIKSAMDVRHAKFIGAADVSALSGIASCANNHVLANEINNAISRSANAKPVRQVPIQMVKRFIVDIETTVRESNTPSIADIDLANNRQRLMDTPIHGLVNQNVNVVILDLLKDQGFRTIGELLDDESWRKVKGVGPQRASQMDSGLMEWMEVHEEDLQEEKKDEPEAKNDDFEGFDDLEDQE